MTASQGLQSTISSRPICNHEPKFRFLHHRTEFGILEKSSTDTYPPWICRKPETDKCNRSL